MGRSLRNIPPMHRTPRMPPTLRMPPADTETSISDRKVAVDFDVSVQSIAALEAAAYRLIGSANCRIERIGERYVCYLTPTANPKVRASSSVEELETHFLDLVTDENLRSRLAEKTEGVRNVIMALAFGSLARSQADSG